MPSVAAYTKKSASAADALIRVIAPAMTMTIASWAMNSRKKFPLANSRSFGLLWTTYATPAVRSSPANIHRNAWDRNAFARRASGLTPRLDGVAPTPRTAGVAGAAGFAAYGDRSWSGFGTWFCVIVRRPPGSLCSPHQAGVARIPPLGQQGHFHVVFDDRLHLFLHLGDHRAGVGAERGGQDHLDLGRIRAEDDLLDEGELHDIHPDLGVHHGAQGVEDGELRRSAGGIERGAVRRRWVGRGRGLICHGPIILASRSDIALRPVSAPDRQGSARDGRPSTDDDARDAVLRGQTGSLALRQARTRERSVGLEEVGVSRSVACRVDVCGSDAQYAELGMVGQDAGQV